MTLLSNYYGLQKSNANICGRSRQPVYKINTILLFYTILSEPEFRLSRQRYKAGEECLIVKLIDKCSMAFLSKKCPHKSHVTTTEY